MVCRELDHEPVRQVGRVVILVTGGNGLSGPRAVEIRGQRFVIVTVITGDGNDLRMVSDEVGGGVFAAEIAALDQKLALIAKADEGSGLPQTKSKVYRSFQSS
jgi:hypothetical protein